ncbi:hypothetical protein ES705_30588 [subsurface metagenome]
MRISEKKFLSFLDVEASKEVAMDDIPAIVKKANQMNQVVLTKEDVRYILRHRERLNNCYSFTNIQSI